MKRTVSLSNRKYGFYWFSVVLVAFTWSIMMAHPLYGAEKSNAAKIDDSVNEALQRFYTQVEDGKEIAKRAKGLLVLPNVGKGALIVGFEYGRGALRVGDKTVDYYSMASGSLGLQIGGEAKDIIITFNNDDALKRFRTAKGWEAGVDGSVAIAKWGAGEDINTQNFKDPIVGFVFGNKGLMAGVSIEGSKITKVEK